LFSACLHKKEVASRVSHGGRFFITGGGCGTAMAGGAAWGSNKDNDTEKK